MAGQYALWYVFLYREMHMSVALDLQRDILPVSDFRANASSVIAQVTETGRPVVLTQRGRSAAVLLDVGVYQSMVDEIEALRDVIAARVELARGEGVAHEDATAQLLARVQG